MRLLLLLMLLCAIALPVAAQDGASDLIAVLLSQQATPVPMPTFAAQPTLLPVHATPVAPVGQPYVVAEPMDGVICQEAHAGDIREVHLLEQPDGSLLVDDGFAPQVLDPTDAPGVYTTESDTVFFAVVLLDEGTAGSLTWTVVEADGGMCREMRLFMEPIVAAAMFATPDSNIEWGIRHPLVPGSYTVRWSGLAGSHCSAAIAALLPEFDRVSITPEDLLYLMPADNGVTYRLQPDVSAYAHMEMLDDDIIMMVGVNHIAGQMLGSANTSTGGGWCTRPFELVAVAE